MSDDLNRVEMAFPVSTIDGYTQYGMTLRDYFAAKAMQGICVNVGRNGFELISMSGIAEYAYELADAMLKARNK